MAQQRAMRADARRNVEKLLDAAREVFRERGLGAPLEAVAARAGVSIGTLYNRFCNREELIDAALPALLAQTLGELSERAVAASTPWDRFAAYIFGLSELQAGDHAFSDAMCSSKYASPAVEKVCRAGLELGSRLIADAQADGSLRADVTVDDLFTALWLNACLADHGGPQAPVVARRQIALLLDGLRSVGQRTLPGGAAEAAAVAARLMRA
ncbi:TetR/AcrR family transcriptional regulator [Mycolicibacterium sp. P9-22]|uniref:TetR/AcrR family transcriptional regulator n=1 Tax=Mycolicibacterium sp. P9-22 TaxID=2024613 RepID=UPI0011EE1956|nr:TetR/AcrR family transcriptional regulator [Mycolicibacterium sp. P9-22]KAA0120003.1 TetR/AcrR family transcriptional regulator [Mycolicibacterium sp. P9-22]